MVVHDNSKLGVHPCHCSSVLPARACTSGSRQKSESRLSHSGGGYMSYEEEDTCQDRVYTQFKTESRRVKTECHGVCVLIA